MYSGRNALASGTIRGVRGAVIALQYAWMLRVGRGACSYRRVREVFLDAARS